MTVTTFFGPSVIHFRSTPHLQSPLSALLYTTCDLTCQGGKDSDDIVTSVQEQVYCELYASPREHFLVDYKYC